MKKILAIAVVALQVIMLVQVSTQFASASTYSQCGDNFDNDRDGKTDEADPGCHTDFNANNAASYSQSINSENNSIDNTATDDGDDAGFAQCSDNFDNDRDGKTDEADPGCHTDFNANNSGSYRGTINSENNSIDNTGGGTSSDAPQCSDGRDNDNDDRADSRDPDCHSDGDASHSGSYNPDDNTEFGSCLNGGCNTPPPPPTNHAPQCPNFTAQYPTYTVSVDSQFTLEIDAVDPDGDSVTYSFGERPSGMSIGSTSGNIAWTPTSGQAGHTYTVTVRARDSEGASCESSFTIRVQEQSNPPPPVVYECSDNIDNDNDGHTDYPSDPGCYSSTDNDEYNSVSSGGASTNTNTNGNVNNNTNINNITIGGNAGTGGAVSGRPQCDDNRDNDGDGEYDYPEDPGCSSRSDNTENTDRNNDDERECNDGRDNDRDGDYDYPEDSGCSSRSDDSERNGGSGDSDDGPYFVSSPSNTAVAGQTYSYNADAISPDDRELEYELVVSPPGMTINSSTGLVQWFAPVSYGNTYQPVLITATDNRGGQATQSFIISVRAQTVAVAATPVYRSSGSTGSVLGASITTPVERLRITNLDIRDEGDGVVVSFRTNIDARGSVRFGRESEIEKTEDFTYPVSRPSTSGDPRFHEVNLGSFVPGRAYYLRAFASASGRIAFSSEIVYVRSLSVVSSLQAEVAGQDTCFDGIDNDGDGAIDGSDPDCRADGDIGRVAGTATFASAIEGFGKFLLSPWFLLFTIIILIIYILITRRRAETVVVHRPIEIKA